MAKPTVGYARTSSDSDDLLEPLITTRRAPFGTMSGTEDTMKGTAGGLDVDGPGSEDAGLQHTQIGQTKRVWYRSVPFQIAVASGVSFTAPGMWDALGGLGAGGAAEPVS